MIKPADRLNHFQTGIFAALDQKKDELIKQGKTVYNLSVGTPDFPPSQDVRDTLIKAASDPVNYRYSLGDLPELLEAVRDYYQRRFGVQGLSLNEIMSVNGTQEGMGHLGMALCNPGDVVLLPDPGYPVFYAGAYFGQAEIACYPLRRENGFLPVLEEIPESVLRRTKYMVVSYPSNPVGAAAPVSMYEKLIAYAKKYDFLIVNDNAYSDIIFDGRQGISFLSLPGAKDCGVEFFSLSKSFNVTGARISFLVGNKAVIDALKLLRTQYDFGMFYPVQYAAIQALQTPRDVILKQCAAYQQRRDALCGGLRRIGWPVPDSQGTMFVFAPIPEPYTSSTDFCKELMEQTGVIGTPGTAFGEMGEGYIRFALTKPVEELEEIVAVIDRSGILKQGR